MANMNDSLEEETKTDQEMSNQWSPCFIIIISNFMYHIFIIYKIGNQF